MAYSTINKSTDYFNTKLFTGNGSTNAITGVGFQPDFIWFKNRTATDSHVVIDSVRGRLGLQPNETNTEYALTASRDFATFDSDGFTVENPSTYNSFNYNTGSIASWNWKANGTGSANTDGSISSTVSANTTSGFSIVKWTGTNSNGTIGHGLGTTPSLFISKSMAGTHAWGVYHKSIGIGSTTLLNSSGASDADATYYGGTSPTSTTMGLGTANATNASGDMIGYAFADVQGYSKFGSYTGNGNADGTVVYLGFKPTFVIMKRTDVADGWLMKDSVRDSYNLANKRIFANVNSAEDTHANGSIDILSNGFKQRGSDTLTNASGGTYIYMAFGQPIISNSGTVATAR